MRIGSAMLATVLAGCAAIPGPGSVRVGDTQEQVRAQLGAPGTERRLAGGAFAWYYMTGPSGFETWRVVFGTGNAVVEYRQVLTAENFVWMREGPNREEVLDRVGPPMQTMVFARSATEAWTYRWRDKTFEMIGEPVFDAGAGTVKYVGIFRDPAYSSTPSSFR